MKLTSTIAIGCLSGLLTAPVFAMSIEYKSIGPSDPLHINGIHKKFHATSFRHERTASFEPNVYVYESLTSWNNKGTAYNVVLVGLTEKNSAVTNGIANFYEKKSNKLIETAAYIHVADHPHTTTFSATGPKR